MTMELHQREEEDPPPPSAAPSPQQIVHLLATSGDYTSYFHASCPAFITVQGASLPDNFEPGKLFSLTANSVLQSTFTELPDIARRVYTSRRDFRSTVLDSLMLTCRLSDYAQSCAVVVQLEPHLVISIPKQGRYIEKAQFRMETGEILDVTVENKLKGDHRHMLLCSSTTPLPASLQEGSRLCYEETMKPSVTTRSLDGFYRGHRPIANLKLLTMIYGEAASFFHSKPDPTLVKIPGTNVLLNGELSEAVRRYQTGWSPFIVETHIEDPEETIRRLLTAMSACYEGDGIQLFVAKRDHALLKLAHDLEEAHECDKKRIIHLVSHEKEASLEEQDRSPYTIFHDWNDNPFVPVFNQFRAKFLKAGKRKRRDILSSMRRAFDEAWKQEWTQDYDIMLTTADMALGWLLKPEYPDTPCHVQQQLKQHVERIVILDVHAWTEAELNALILNFTNLSQLQFHFFGDPAQTPAFHTYNNSIPSELETVSALQVIKRKSNIPCIKIRQVFTPPPPPPVVPAQTLYSDLGKPHTGVKFRTIASGVVPYYQIKGATDIVRCALERVGRLHRMGTIIGEEEGFSAVKETRIPIDYDVLLLENMGREPEVVVDLWTTNSRSLLMQCFSFYAYSEGPKQAVRRHKYVMTVLDHTNACQRHNQHGILGVVPYRPHAGGPCQSDRDHRGDPTRYYRRRYEA